MKLTAHRGVDEKLEEIKLKAAQALLNPAAQPWRAAFEILILLAALLYGAVVGLVRASAEGRIQLTDEVLESAEQACWELIRA